MAPPGGGVRSYTSGSVNADASADVCGEPGWRREAFLDAPLLPVDLGGALSLTRSRGR